MSIHFDVAGIGAGPFNLSVAALLAPHGRIRSAFFDRREQFDWHPGMMVDDAAMQTSFLKDLVLSADPTSAYSFIAYLVAKHRFHRFIHAGFTHVRRYEFADYLQWVAEKLPNLHFKHEVQEIRWSENGFRLQFDGKCEHARHLVVATGLTPNIPDWARRHEHPRCLHSHHYLARVPDATGLRIAVVGGGQSGAEVVLDLMSGRRGRTQSICWLSRRHTLEALDEAPFSNEFFTPSYVNAFHSLPMACKPALIRQQTLTGNGISHETLRQIYQTLYLSSLQEGWEQRLRILPHRDVRAMECLPAGGWILAAHNGFDDRIHHVDADVVVLATGYLTRLPACIEPLRGRLNIDQQGHLPLRHDFSVPWDGPADHHIFVQNGGLHSHGIADPQLSLAAWRGAIIANAILGEERYATAAPPFPIEWASEAAPGSWSQRGQDHT